MQEVFKTGEDSMYASSACKVDPTYALSVCVMLLTISASVDREQIVVERVNPQKISPIYTRLSHPVG